MWIHEPARHHNVDHDFGLSESLEILLPAYSFFLLLSHSVYFMPTKPCVHLLDAKLRIWGVAERSEAAK